MDNSSIPSTAIPCNISEEEREALRTLAKDQGFSSVSKLVRFCIVEKYGTELEDLVNHNRKRRSGELMNCKAG